MKIIAFLIAFGFMKIGFTQKTESFDLATYKVPIGWQKESNAGMVSYQSINKEKNIFCAINIYASSISYGTVAEEFQTQWQKLVAVPFTIKEAPAKDTASDDEGLKFITGSGSFVKGNLNGIAMLGVYVGFGKTTSILFLTNDKSYFKTIEDFLSGFTIKKTAMVKPVIIAPNAKVVNSKPIHNNSGNTFHNTNKLEGVWNGLNYNINNSPYNYNKLAGNTPIWLTFFDNGRVYSTLPENMNSFNKNADDIGFYQLTNGTAGLQWFKGTATTDIEFISKDQIRVHAASGDQNYFHCKAVDGAKLDGAWTTFANTTDPELDAPGVKPQIHFTRGGRFTDDGIFMTLFNDVKIQPGSGTYSLNNFTLTLNYDNGVTQQSSFTGFLASDVNILNDVLFIDRHRFRKR
jgi:hypothetical protein